MARVVLEDLSKVFNGGVAAVNGVSVDVADGEFMVVVGPSGCGKTTLLRLIAGLEDVSGGRISIGGEVVNEAPTRERDVAMVFQHCALYPHMTVFENMAFGLRMRRVGRTDIRGRVEGAAEMLGIDGLLWRKPRTLSGGEAQRVAIGRAIVRNPRVFLLDEPLSNLDAGMRLTMRAELKRLHRRLGTTTIYVTHDQAEAMSLGDRVCVMREGRVEQVGRPMDVYEHCVNRFVAGFFGSPPMNFFEGRIERRGEGYCFVFGENGTPLPSRFTDRLGGYVGQEILLGIRPEDFAFGRSGDEGEICIRGKVQMIEPLGDRKEVHIACKSGRGFVVGVWGRAGIEAGEEIEAYARAEAMHLFEGGAAGRNILL